MVAEIPKWWLVEVNHDKQEQTQHTPLTVNPPTAQNFPENIQISIMEIVFAR